MANREREMAATPQTISHVESATIPLAGMAAWDAMVKVAQVAAGP